MASMAHAKHLIATAAQMDSQSAQRHTGMEVRPERVIGRDALTRSVPYCLFRGTAERKISEVGTTCIVRNQGANTPQSMLSTHVKPLKLA